MPSRNTKYAAIPEVGNDLQSIATAVRALKQTVDVLSRQTGPEEEWAATVSDVSKAVTRVTTSVTQNPNFSKLINDPVLDKILDRAQQRADKLTQQARQEARIALATLQNALESLRVGYDDINAVVKSEVKRLEASIGDADAKITTEKLARVTANQALTGRIDTVSAELAGNVAAVTNEIVALSGPNGAIATQINAVTTASTNARTFVQSTTPRSLASGDYWVDLGSTPPPVRQWDGSLWTSVATTFAATAPSSPSLGQLWFDTTNSLLKQYNGSSWVTQTSAFIQSRTPSSLSVGDLWVDTAQANLIKKWTGTAWEAVTNIDSLGVLLSTVVTESISKTDADKTTGTRLDNLVSIGPDGNTATINGAQLTTATRTDAIASDLTSLEAQTTGGTAGGFYRLIASSNPTDGAAAEFQVQVRAAESGANSTFVSSGMRIQAFSNGTSRVKFNTDQFIVTSSSGTYTPFAITSGQLAIDAIVAANKVSGLGTLATKNSVSTSEVSGLGQFAVLDKIRSSNVATYIDLAAISSAYIGDLDAGKITTGSLSANRVSTGTLTGVSILITASNGNYIIQANANGGSGPFFWRPVVSALSAGNIADSGSPSVAGSANFVEAASFYGATGTSLNHGLRAGCAAGTSGLVGVANGYDFYAEGGGTNYGPFTGAHDALLPVGYEIELGEIVVDVECIARRGVSNVICRVEKSSRPNQKGAVGVVAFKHGPLADAMPPAVFDQNPPAAMQAPRDPSVEWPIVVTQEQYVENEMTPIWEAVKNNYDYIAMNALGEGQVQVCGEGGDIEVGDLITTSSIPGKGMKQVDDLVRNYTVAKARESVTFSSPSEVKLVACIYLCG